MDGSEQLAKARKVLNITGDYTKETLFDTFLKQLDLLDDSYKYLLKQFNDNEIKRPFVTSIPSDHNSEFPSLPDNV